MRPLAFSAAVLLLVGPVLADPASAQPAPGPCGITAPKAVELTDPDLSPDFAPTQPTVRYLIDLGSDGRVRHVRTTTSSGDPSLDAAGERALQSSKFAPAKELCVAVSSVFEFYFDLSAYNASPHSETSPLPTASAPAAEPCIPFIQGMLRHFKPPANARGTVSIDVSLDAEANVRKASVAHGSGDPTLDEISRKAARNAQFAFHHQPGCKPAPTSYSFEMTYAPPT